MAREHSTNLFTPTVLFNRCIPDNTTNLVSTNVVHCCLTVLCQVPCQYFAINPQFCQHLRPMSCFLLPPTNAYPLPQQTAFPFLPTKGWVVKKKFSSSLPSQNV
eukprot:scpid21160/ scgid34637/ 